MGVVSVEQLVVAEREEVLEERPSQAGRERGGVGARERAARGGERAVAHELLARRVPPLPQPPPASAT